MDNTYKYLAMAPCFFGPANDSFDSYAHVNDECFDKYGIVALNGPNEDRDIQTITDNCGKEALDYYMGWKGQGLGDAVKTQVHWTQNYIADTFQEWVTNFSESNYMGVPVNTDAIDKIPITVFQGELD